MNLNTNHKLLSAQSIREADQYTITHEPVASIDLMERASIAFVNRFLALYSANSPVVVLAGMGNNGGDGLAVARLLLEKSYQVSTFTIGDQEKISSDCQANLDRLASLKGVKHLSSSEDFPSFEENTIIIDAIFGSGLTRPVSGLYGELIAYVNADASVEVVAVDIASGLGTDENIEGGEIMEVETTISFQVPKLSFFFPQNHPYTGQLFIEDIGLDQRYIDAAPSVYYQLSLGFVRSILRTPSKYAHKGTMGKDLLIAGSLGKMGAAVLSARACLKSGAGLLTVSVPTCGISVLQTTVPEAMIDPNGGEKCVAEVPSLAAYQAVGVGPGLGTEEATQQMFAQLMEDINIPMVLDADALNMLAMNPDLMTKIPKGSILTPHVGEFKRLVGEWSDDYDRLQKQIDLAVAFQVNVVLKGANTSITTPEGQVFFNPTGNAGMATAGSGDVLTGMLTALLGQGYSGIEAAILGVYLHGLAGDIYTETSAEQSLIASDLIQNIGKAIRGV